MGELKTTLVSELAQSFKDEYVQKGRERYHQRDSQMEYALDLACDKLASLLLDSNIALARSEATRGNASDSRERGNSEAGDTGAKDALLAEQRARNPEASWPGSLVTCPGCDDRTELYPNREYRIFCNCGYIEKVIPQGSIPGA